MNPPLFTLGDRLFFPQDPARVTMYVCGPTVYAPPHIGNLRSAVVFDVLFRVLRRIYGAEAVVFARNYTDIDDKIIFAALNSGGWPRDVTEPAIAAYRSATAKLNVLEPTLTPRVTEHVDQIIAFIAALIESGHAYVADEAGMEQHVFFDRQRYPEFFLNINMDPANLPQEDDGESSRKRHRHDFVLWKPVTSEKPQGWMSPWGLGRPGWHIECSAMILEHLGETIDIHGGGNDLRFPHHESECAQSVARTGKMLANYWLHNGMLTVEDGKLGEMGAMGKSLGNARTLEGLLGTVPGLAPEAIRYYLLSAHYPQPLGFSRERLEQAMSSVKSLHRAMRKVGPMQPDYTYMGPLLDDLNTPRALSELHALASRIHGNTAGDDEIAQFIGLADVLGLHTGYEAAIESDEIISLKEQREAARARRDFVEADRLREVLLSMGAEINDAPLKAVTT